MHKGESMDISKKLTNIRLTLNLTTEEMAQKLGVNQSTISRSEKETDNIKIGRIKSYCDLAGITLEEFFCNDISTANIKPEIQEMLAFLNKFTPEQISLLKNFLKSLHDIRD